MLCPQHAQASNLHLLLGTAAYMKPMDGAYDSLRLKPVPNQYTHICGKINAPPLYFQTDVVFPFHQCSHPLNAVMQVVRFSKRHPISHVLSCCHYRTAIAFRPSFSFRGPLDLLPYSLRTSAGWIRWLVETMRCAKACIQDKDTQKTSERQNIKTYNTTKPVFSRCCSWRASASRIQRCK